MEPLRRWPWLTRRRQVVLALLVAVATVGIPWNHRHSQRGFLAQVSQALPMSAALSADAIGDWVALRAAHARTLARVASQPGTATATERLAAILPELVREGGFADGRVELALADAPQAALESVPPLQQEGNAIAEFRAPIMRDGRMVAQVLLRAELTEHALPHFNIAAADDRTQRTVLLLRRDGDATRPMQLLAASAPGGGERAIAMVSVPSGITADGAARASYASVPRVARTPHGIGTGVAGTSVVYATARVPGTPWLLVREREVSELLARIGPALVLTDAIFSALAALLIGVLLMRWRAVYLREVAAAVQLRATFVASVSHELRTPLTQVRMYAEMLRLDLLSEPEERAQALRVIEKEAERLTLLIERALAFVRTGQPTQASPRQAVRVDQAVRRATEALHALANERKVRIQCDLAANLAVQMSADDLHQVLLNLLDNAIKYGPVGQLLHVSSESRGDQVILSVRDQGPGVPPPERELIWLPFRRGHAAMTGAATGTGIGLVVVRDLVERAGGRVRVTSPERDASAASHPPGACFVVELPRGDDAP